MFCVFTEKYLKYFLFVERKNIIILKQGGTLEAWGSITEVCKNRKEFKYSTIKGRKFPFEYKGWEVIKVPFKTKAK